MSACVGCGALLNEEIISLTYAETDDRDKDTPRFTLNTCPNCKSIVNDILKLTKRDFALEMAAVNTLLAVLQFRIDAEYRRIAEVDTLTQLMKLNDPKQIN